MNNKSKRGNVEIIFLTIFVVILLIILSATYICYLQINSIIYPIKQDLFYIVQNSYFSLDKEELSYSNYEINEVELRMKIDRIISLNYPNKNVKIENVSFNKLTETVDIEIEIILRPIILSNKIGSLKIFMVDKIKLKNMEVK